MTSNSVASSKSFFESDVWALSDIIAVLGVCLSYQHISMLSFIKHQIHISWVVDSWSGRVTITRLTLYGIAIYPLQRQHVGFNHC